MSDGPSKLVRGGVGSGIRIEPVTGGRSASPVVADCGRHEMRRAVTALACGHALAPLWELPTQPLTGWIAASEPIYRLTRPPTRGT
jgi:hypothetical protein